MYLTREVVIDTLRYVVSFARGDGSVFDYSGSLATLSVARRLIVRAVMLRLAVIGEPWRALFTTQELYGLLGTLGYPHVADISPAAINTRYFSARSDMLRVGGSDGLIKAWV
jgi:hypothetical protein